ncbi:MAG: putative lipoprotein transrane [Gammaproteobacteria bacterium]|nr:putative lipoprotein transrane [Gammaproteobacteria bacterium]
MRTKMSRILPVGVLALGLAAAVFATEKQRVPDHGAGGARLLYIMNVHNLEMAKAEVPLDATLVKRLQKTVDNDQKVIERLKSLHFVVSVADEHPSSDVVSGEDLIVISNSVNARQMTSRFASLNVPIVTWASDLYPVLHMTGNVAGQDYGTTGTVGGKDGDRFTSIVNAPHPLAAGLAADAIQDLYDDNEFITNWGKPSLGAINIAVIEGFPDKRLVFAYEKGASMAGNALAPARRVAYFLNTEDFGELQPAGLALLDAAVLWASRSPR